jgi:hypothetical protein
MTWGVDTTTPFKQETLNTKMWCGWPTPFS